MLGVCIRYFHENYGGMLQAYATTKILEKRNIKYEIIRYKKKKNVIFLLKSFPRIFNNILLNDKYEAFQKKFNLMVHPEFRKNNEIRMKAFDKFRTTYFSENLSKLNYGYDELKKNANKYSGVLTGSDQLWSPAGLPTNFYNLMFVPDNIIKISYASSFGVSYIPWYQKRRTKHFLNRLDFISVRENAAKKIVKELTNRDVEVVLDPVFMLSTEDWENIIDKKRIIPEKYVFTYFLGNNQEYRKKITEFAKLNNYKIVTLRHLDQYVKSDEKFGDIALYDVTPADFLNLLKNSEYVFTDSFHGSAFSIIFNKQFMVFNRYSNKSKHSKNSRIDTLCKNLELMDCRYNGNIDIIKNNNIEYEKVNKNVSLLVKKAEKYLDKCFEKVN